MVKAVTGLRARVRTRGGTTMSRAKTPSAMAQKGHGRDQTAAPRPRSARPIALIFHSPRCPDYRRSRPTRRGSHPDVWRAERARPARLRLEVGLNPGYYRLAHMA